MTKVKSKMAHYKVSVDPTNTINASEKVNSKMINCMAGAELFIQRVITMLDNS
jgi:hypothetical protein